jgi:ABC-type sulfate transport system permease component
MEKRVLFKSAWLPWVLIAPQMAVILIFFFWPAGQALWQSLLQQDAFGSSSEFVGMENFKRLFNDPSYLDSFKTTAIFSVLVAVGGLALSLLLAVMANRVVRGSGIYKTLLIWPYAVAPVVAGVLWLMMFASPYGVIRYALIEMGFEWNHLLNANHAMGLIVVAAIWKHLSYNFLFFLAGLQSIPQSLIVEALLDHRVPAAVAHHVLPAGDQHHLLVLRDVRHRGRGNARRPGQGDRHPRLQGVLRRLQGAGHQRLGRAVGGADGHRGRAHGRPVPLRREEGPLLTWSSANPSSPSSRTSS